MKTQILIGALSTCLVPVAAQATVIVAIDQFRSSTTNLTPANFAVQDGVDVEITRSGIDGNGLSATPSVNSDGSQDGSVGSVAVPGLSTAQSINGESFRWTNGAEAATFDFAFTDTSGTDRLLSTFHFDGGVNRPNVARDFTLVLAGAETVLGSGTIPLESGGPEAEYTNFDIDLGGITLAANSTVTFSLRFTSSDAVGVASGHNGHLDNVGLSTGVIPEPSSMALLGLGSLALATRRRKSAEG